MKNILRTLLFFALSMGLLLGCNDYMTKDVFIGSSDTESDPGDGDGGDGGDGGGDTGSPDDDDADGLSNELEDTFGGETRQADTDQDGFDDGLEFVASGGDPLSASLTPNSFNRTRILDIDDAIRNDPDRDLDGLGDTFERSNGLNPEDPDIDDDGYQDGLELVANSDPFDAADRPERDAPPAPDGVDRLPPGPRDSDGDGLSNEIEELNGTVTTQRDTDGDGFSDGIELLMGSDATDVLAIPNFNVPSPPAT